MADNIWLRVAWKVNHCLAVVLPAPCDGPTHLGRGLVDHVPAGEVDVVAGSHRVEEASLVDLHVLGGQDSQESLQYLELDPLVCVRPTEARANGLHDDVYLPLVRILHTDTVT